MDAGGMGRRVALPIKYYASRLINMAKIGENECGICCSWRPNWQLSRAPPFIIEVETFVKNEVGGAD